MYSIQWKCCYKAGTVKRLQERAKTVKCFTIDTYPKQLNGNKYGKSRKHIFPRDVIAKNVEIFDEFNNIRGYVCMRFYMFPVHRFDLRIKHC